MGTKTRTSFLCAGTFFFIQSLQSQVISNRGDNLNSRQQNVITGSGNWEMGVSTGLSFSLKNDETNLFRGYGFGTKMFGKYYFGKFGISATTGLLSGTISGDAINDFSKERELKQEDINVVKGNPQNGYFLAGPSLRFGGKLAVNAELQAGLFLNNPGTVDISMKGSDRAIYRFDNGGKNIFPGFSGSIGINYSIGTTTRLFITADYLQSKTSINYLDMKNGFDVVTKLNRDVKIMFAGIGIVKTFGCGRKLTGKRLAVIKNDADNLTNDYTGEKQAAQGYNSFLPGKIYFSIGMNGTIAGELNTDVTNTSSPEKSYLIIGNDGTLTGKLNAQDFNTCRSNRERGMGFTTHSQNNSLADEQLANNNNAPTLGKVYFSVKENGAITGELNTDVKNNSSPEKSYLIIGDDGTLTGKLNAQDFNTCRSNRERGMGFATHSQNNSLEDPQFANNNNAPTLGKIYFSVTEKGAIAGALNTDAKNTSSPEKSYLIIGDDGTLTGKLNAQDFNTCRSNRERGMGFTTHSQNNSLADAQLANNNNAKTLGKVYFSVKENGAITGELNTDVKNNSSPEKSYLIIGDDGTLTGKLNAQDFNTCRSNRERGMGFTTQSQNNSLEDPQLANNNNTPTLGKVYFSVSENGAIAGELNTDEKNTSSPEKSYLIIGDDGTLTGKLNAQDFNTCRSNHVRGNGK